MKIQALNAMILCKSQLECVLLCLGGAMPCFFRVSSSFACCRGEFKTFNKTYRTTKSAYSFSPATPASASFEWHRLTKYSQQKWNSLHFHLIINLPLVLKCARCKIVCSRRRRVLSFVLKHLFLFVLFEKSVEPTHLISVKKIPHESRFEVVYKKWKQTC